jgi:ABC-2 type transport system ATP-binding protein
MMIRLDQVTKSFGARNAVDGFSFTVGAGEMVALLGPNGAGKTTLLKLMLGLLRPTSGSVLIAGLPPASAPEKVRSLVGYSPDEPSFYDFLSGRETIDFVVDTRNLDRQASWEALEPLFAALAFDEELEALTSTYSHGTKKKLALLLALVHDPPVLLLDEPTNGLDPRAAKALCAMLEEKRSAGRTIILSTHRLDIAERFASRVVVVDHGRLVAEGTPSELRAKLPNGSSLEDVFFQVIGDHAG